ncbi:MAG: hypothetical protein ACLFR0_03205 [Alphaproteobacteria bacterium]
MPISHGSGPLQQHAPVTQAQGYLAQKALEALPPLNAPERLTIRFSRASDIDNFVDLYSGPRKYRIDPKGFIRERSYEELVKSVKAGAAILALDENGHIRASALADRLHDQNNPENNFTEIGAVMCDVGGIGLPNLVVGMLALKQYFDPLANASVFAKVAHDNEASNHVFGKSMRWHKVENEDKRKALFDLAYAGKKDGNRSRTWYAFTASAANVAEEAIKKAIENEALHGKSGKTVPLDIASSSLWSTLQFHEMLACRHDAA